MTSDRCDFALRGVRGDNSGGVREFSLFIEED